jgi:hypothetical protein
MANDGGLKRYYLSEGGYICDGWRPEDSLVLDESELVDLANKSAALESQLAEARAEIERLHQECERQHGLTADQFDRAEAAEARFAECEEKLWKMVEKVALALDLAERYQRERDEARAKLARADRLAEAMGSPGDCRCCHCVSTQKCECLPCPACLIREEALDVYRSDFPPGTEGEKT